MAWQDDPMGFPALERPVPKLAKRPLELEIRGPVIPPGRYEPGTAGFRYWTAAEALRRGADFWAPTLGLRRWQGGGKLRVGLDEGDDLNAYYDRSQLAFFHAAAGGQTVYSGESPDVACHELGHACLDAHRPELWDAPFLEVGAFHESFGDMSAILSALQLPTVRAAALEALKRRKPSELTRVAEQLGWALRQTYPDDVDPDSLRNAWNRFEYVDSNTLPDYAPATRLSAEVHSFSRVFTGAFHDALSGMLRLRSGKPTSTDLAAVARDLGQLLADATRAAPVAPNYFAQVAAHLVDADAARFSGEYRAALVKAFVDRKIIPRTAVESVVAAPRATRKQAAMFAAARMVRPPEPRIQTVKVDAKELGFDDRPLHVDVPVEHKPARTLSVAITQPQSVEDPGVERAARRFVEALFAHRCVCLEIPDGPGMVPQRGERRCHTHAVVEARGALRLIRRRFDCRRG